MERLKNKAYHALRRSEGFFKTDMVYLAKGGFWLTVGQVLSAASSFILAIGFAHFISKDGYGTYKYIMSVGGIFAAFSLSGLGTAVTNAAAKGEDGTLPFAFNKSLLYGSLTFILFAGGAGYYFSHGNQALALGLLIIGTLTPFLNSASLANSFFIGKKDFKRSTLTANGAQMITNLVTLAAAFVSGNVLVLIAAYVLSGTLLEIGVYLYALHIYRPDNRKVDAKALSYGAHLSAIGILNVFVDRLDSVLTFHFLGPAELAVYSFAIAIPEQIKGMAKNIAPLSQPKFTLTDPGEIHRNMGKKMFVMGLVTALAILAYVLLAPFIFQLFFPQYYSPMTIFLSRLFSLSLITVVGTLPISYLQAKGHKTELYQLNTIGGVAQIALMAAGVISYGLLGLVIGIILSRFLRLALSVALFRRTKAASL